MTPRDHVARAQALAEAATDPRDVAVYRAVIAAWTRVASPPCTWSLAPATRQLVQLQRDIAQLLPTAPTAPAEPAQTRGNCQIGATHRVPVTTITF